MSEPTKETKHTPTPWRYHSGQIVKDWPTQGHVLLAETRIPRWHEDRIKGVEEAGANARYIIEAVNEREALLAQNDLLKKELQGWIDNSERWKLENDALFLERDRLMEALKKVYRAECFKDGHTVIEIHGKITDERHCMCMMIGVEKVISQSEKRP